MIRTAACRCRGCAVEVEGEPVSNLICHCTDCKRRTGGPCGWTAVFRTDQVLSRRGAFSLYASDGAAGRTANAFCAACGTTLVLAPEAFPGIIGLAGGCFADDPLGEPTLSASDDQRCGWMRLPEGWEVRTSGAAAAGRPGRSSA